MSDAEKKDHAASSDDPHGKPGGQHGRHKKGGHGHGGGHEEGHEGAPEWLISFADNVMLQMGFFVILFALNISPQRAAMGGSAEEPEHGAPGAATASMLDFAIAMRAAFNNPVNIDSSDPADQALIQRILERSGKGKSQDPGVAGDLENVQSLRPTEYYAVSGSVLFAEESAEIPTASEPTIAQIAEKVRGRTLVVEIRGHASAGESALDAENAMRLSAARALAVATALAGRGVDWWQMRLVVCADNDRVNAFPGSDTDDAANARVEVVVTNEIVSPKVPTSPAQVPRNGASQH